MDEENISQEFRLKNIEEIKIYLIKEKDQNRLTSNKHKKVCMTLNYIEHFILASAVTRYILISAFTSLLGISIGITSSATGLKIYTITARIKKLKSKRRKSMIKYS